jgi:hypothetical protein
VFDTRRSSTLHAALALVLGLVLVSCGKEDRPPAETEVRALIERAERLAEEGDIEAFRDLISEDYSDGRGNNRQSIVLLLNYYFSANRNIHLLTRTPQVHLPDSTHADLLVFVAMAGRPIAGPDRLTTVNADLYHVYASVALEGDVWRITSARWARGWEAEMDAAAAGRILRDRR